VLAVGHCPQGETTVDPQVLGVAEERFTWRARHVKRLFTM
jgi:hypothetical protein